VPKVTIVVTLWLMGMGGQNPTPNADNGSCASERASIVLGYAVEVMEDAGKIQMACLDQI
jgi:hypothetical protein